MRRIGYGTRIGRTNKIIIIKVNIITITISSGILCITIVVCPNLVTIRRYAITIVSINIITGQISHYLSPHNKSAIKFIIRTKGINTGKILINCFNKVSTHSNIIKIPFYKF